MPIDLNYNHFPGDNRRGDGECTLGGSRQMFLSRSQESSTNTGNPGFGSWDFLWEVDCLPLQPSKRAKGRRGPATEGSLKCQMNNGQSSPVPRGSPGALTARSGCPALKTAGQGQDGHGGAWDPPFQISWPLSICLANSVLSTLKRLLISFLDNKSLSEVVVKCIFIYLWE